MTVREGLQIEISGIPAENGKCRVETQLKITLQLKDAKGESVKDWKQLRLPRPLIAKEKHRMEKFNGRSKHVQDSEILTLDARLVCDHDMTKILECCDNCIGRERKRAHRRKESQKLPGALSSIPVFGSISAKKAGASLTNEAVPPTPTDPIEYQAWERSRIMVFSSTEYVDISSGQCLLPTRITCYCRHHNEKVGFRIQFTAKDPTGAVVAAVLTNPVMMMDDHKSGKRAIPTQPKTAGTAGSSSTRKSSARRTSTVADGSAEDLDITEDKAMQQQEFDEDEDDMDQDEGAAEDEDEIDLEAGHHVPHHNFSKDSYKSEDAEILSGDILAPLSSGADRVGTKRRVDENMMEDIQSQSNMDPLRGPFRRKTSHDVAAGVAGTPSSFASLALKFPSFTAPSAQSPFVSNSLFSNGTQGNAFAPSFGQAPGNGESFLDQKSIDMFLQSGLSTSPAHLRSDLLHRRPSKDLADHDSIMEFTTLDEPMSSPPDGFLSTGTSAAKPGQSHDQPPTPVTSQAVTTRASFTIPVSVPDFPSTPTTTSANGSNPFSSAGMFSSAFSSTFSSPLNTSAPTSSMMNAPGMSSSFLDASQMQEFQNFKRQSLLQQKQQQLLMQLQQGVQQQAQMETKPVPWTASDSNNSSKDPFWNMKMAMSQTTDPSSSAFIKDTTANPASDANDSEISKTVPSTAASDAPLAPKKRGRPRKTAAAATSEASSPILSSKAPTALPPSPSPPPLATPSASAAAAAQFMLLQQHQHQQQQLHHHQQQLQQQQKQAILARQKPRIQKVIPSRGPVEGGVEITLLGSGFFPGMVPTFDGVPALSVQYYGPETMICRLPPRNFPGSVIVKAQNPLTALASSASGSGLGAGKDDATSNGLVRTMTQLFGGPSGAPGSSLLLGDDDVGVYFEYEESKGDRDLIALALQVLGMKMNGRVEPPHQVAMRIMDTAAASNVIMGQNGPSSQAQLQLPQQPQQSLLGFGNFQSNMLQQNALSHQAQLLQQTQQPQSLQLQQQQQQQQTPFGVLQAQSGSMANGSVLGTGMLGFGNFLNSMGGSNGSGL